MPNRQKHISKMWLEQQPKYVELPPDDSEIRPTLEKMRSCDLSVEESYTITQSSDEEIITSICGFPRKPSRSTCLWKLTAELEEKEATLKKIGLESYYRPEEQKFLKELEVEKLGFGSVAWKVGAVKGEKARSPTEHDEEKPNAIEGDVECERVESSFFPEDKQDNYIVNLDVKVQCGDKKIASTLNNGTVKCQNSQGKKKDTVKRKAQGPIQRQNIAKKKRNKLIILCEEEPPKPVKKQKLSAQKGYKRKVDKKSHNKIQCEDSGVSTGSGSSCGGNSGCNDGKSGGGGEGEGRDGVGSGGSGGGPFHGNGGGGDGRDDDSDKRPFSSGDTEMKDEEEMDEDDDIKMKSKGHSEMDCEDDSLDCKNLKFKTQHLQHSCYCLKNDCDKPLCVQMKKELNHYKNQFKENCSRCQKITNLIKLHASTCHRSVCRVPYCISMRAKKGAKAQLVHEDACYNVQVPNLPILPSIDGKVIYSDTQNSQFGTCFQEGIDYCQGKLLGSGTNGSVYQVCFPQGSPLNAKPMVVKFTNYSVNSEEIKVYRHLGHHENIVKHFCVTFKGHDYKTSVFMELCDKSLKDICNGREMDTNEAMFYWTQVLSGVLHLHDNNIIHKDIKSKNVLLSELPGEGEYCRAKLADFDSAKMLETEFTQSGLKPMGTPGFVADEVMDKKPHGRPADIYSLGCLLLELKGVNPKREILRQQVEELCAKDFNLGQLVIWCVQHDPCQRPTARDLMNLPYIQGFLRVPDQV